MKYPPKLTPAQFDLIEKADFAQVYIWYNELFGAAKVSSEINRLQQYLNEVMKEKA